MRNAVRLLMLCVIVAAVSACNGKPADQPSQKVQAEQKATPADASAGKERALAFLGGVQAGDKAKVYQAANITKEQVDSCRDKLIHIKQNKMSDAERSACEHALKISGDVDFFCAKLRKILPPSATLKITQSSEAGTPTLHLVHTVSVTYGNKAEAVVDKTGKAVKELKLALLQFDHPFQGGQVHEFSFSGQDFEKMANKDFEVGSYF